MVQVIRVNGEEIALNKLSHVSDAEVAVSKEIWAEMLSRIERLRWLTA